MKTPVRLKGLQRSAMAVAVCLASVSVSSVAYAGCSASTSGPYDLYSKTQFRGILDKSVHQYNTSGASSTNCVSTTQLKGGYWADNTSSTTEDYFYNKNETGIGDTLVFKINEGDKARSELRVNSFDATKVKPKLTANFLLRGTYSSMASEFTVAQIHIDKNTSTFGKTDSPMLRMEFRKSASYNGSTYTDHIWAIFRPDPEVNSGTGAYTKIPIAPAKRNGGSANLNSMSLEYNLSSTDKRVKVVFNGVTKYFDISKWRNSEIDLYFKAGCYTQTSGSCTSQFSTLTVSGI